MSDPGALQGLGRNLRQARERKGWTVDQVAEKTRITARHLNEIEAGDFERFPAAVYARGFVRAYAKVLDLDEAAALASLDEAGILAPTAARPPALAAAGKPAPVEAPVRDSKGRRTFMLAGGAVAAGVVAGAVLLLVSRLGDVRSESQPPPSPFAAPPAPQSASPAPRPKAPAPKPAASVEKAGLAVPSIPGFPVVVAASARQDCVFQFQVDGENRVRWWTLKAGAQTVFKAKKSLRLLITNPAGIEAAGPGGPLPLVRGTRRPDHFMITAAGVERIALPPEATPSP